MEPDRLNSKQIHVFFTGKVQGVGFRWTTQSISAELKLAGWVKNLPDGRVEMLAEGPTKDLQSLMDRLSNRFSIQSVELRDSAFTGKFSGFEIIT